MVRVSLRPVRKRESRNNRTTKASQRIEPDESAKDKKKARPKGRSVGGPWIRK